MTARGVRNAGLKPEGWPHDGDPLGYLWNFATGACLDGQRRSNAGWLRPGNIALVINHRPPLRWWHLRPRLARAAIRWVCTAVTIVVGWAYYQEPGETVTWLTRSAFLTCVAGLAGAGYWATSRLLGWRVRREWVWPLHTALHDIIGFDEWVRPESYIHVPRDFPDGHGSISLELPADFTGAINELGGEQDSYMDRQLARIGKASLIKQVLTEKLPLHEKQFVTHLRGREHWLEILPVPQPPSVVLSTNIHVQALLESLPEDQLLSGLYALPIGASEKDVSKGDVHAAELRAGGRPEIVDLSAETPHIGVFAKAGEGKSVTVAGLAAQVLRKGGQVVFIDIMAISHNWARGLPGVTYLSSVPDIHNGLVTLAAEGLARNQVILNWDDDDTEPDVGPRVLIVFEEVNATFRKLDRYWKRHRATSDQKESPAVEAYEDLIFCGRKQKMNVLIVGQSGTTRHMGGTEIRENLQGGILMSGWSTNAWRMLVGPNSKPPKPGGPKGRWRMVRAGAHKAVQVVYFSDPKYRRKDSELCRWALGGIMPEPSPFADILATFDEPLRSIDAATKLLPSGEPLDTVTPSHVTDTPSDVEGEPVTVTARHLQAVPDTPAEQAKDELISLRKALETGVIAGPTIDAVRQRRQRHKDSFPQRKGKDGQEHLYSRNELAFWDRNSRQEEGESA